MEGERIAERVTGLRRRLSHRLGRALPGGDGLRWRVGFRRAVAARGAAAVLRAHPCYDRIAGDFTIGGYLMRNPDVMDATDGPAEALFHFLEYGMAEGRDTHPDHWCPAFVRTYHGVELSPDLDPREAATRLRATGIDPLEARLNGADLWLGLGVHGPALERFFEHETYAVLARAAGHPPEATDRLTCIAHAVSVGLPEGIPLHPFHRLDHSFYRAALKMVGVAVPAGDLHRHWGRMGLRIGAHANAGAYVWTETGLHVPNEILALLSEFRAAAPDLTKSASDPVTLRHLIEMPAPGAAAFATGHANTRAFLRGLARNRIAQDDAAGAQALLDLLHEADPTDAAVAVDLARLLERAGQKRRALALRQSALGGPHDAENRIALARLQGDAGQIANAIDTLPPALPNPDDTRMTRLRDVLIEEFFNEISGDLPGWIDAHGLAEVQRLLTHLLTLATPSLGAGRRDRPIRRVAILANRDLPQCHLYRAVQSAEQLRAAGCDATVFDTAGCLDTLKAGLDQFDALILARVPGSPRVVALIGQARAMGIGTFYDADDPVFDPAVFPPPQQTYAGCLTAGERDLIACGVPLFAQALALCDAGIAATPALRDAMAPLTSGGIAILRRNGLGSVHARAVAAAEGTVRREKLVLFHGSATRAHKAAFHAVLEPALARVLAARPGRVSIRLMGSFARFTHLDPPHPDVEIRPAIPDFEAYAELLADADIALAVIDDTAAAQMKSEVKWLEAAMFGLPTVASDAGAFRDVIADGETGFLCRDTDAFTERLLHLIDDGDLRARMGRAARAQVMRERDPARMGRALLEAMQGAAPKTSPKTRLLVVNVFFPPRDRGGATHIVRDNVRDLLVRYGDAYEIDVIALRPGAARPYSVDCDAWMGARVWTIGAPSDVHAMTLHDPAMGDVVDRLMARIAPDLVHFHCIQHLTLSAVDVARRRAIPYVVTLHDGWWISPEQFILGSYGSPALYDYRVADHADRPDRARILAPRLRDAAALLAVSEPFAELHRAAGLPNVRAVENGVAPQSAWPRKPGPPGRVRLGHVGGAQRIKGAALLRAAIESVRLCNIDLSIIDHDLPRGVQRREVWNGTPVSVQPRVAPEDMAAHYAGLDVLVAPSIWPESFGLVTREATAAGLWVVASDQGAIADGIVEGVTGHIVPVDDPGPLAACLQRIDAEPARYAAAPTHGNPPRPSTAQADALNEIYRGILARRP